MRKANEKFAPYDMSREGLYKALVGVALATAVVMIGASCASDGTPDAGGAAADPTTAPTVAPTSVGDTSTTTATSTTIEPASPTTTDPPPTTTTTSTTTTTPAQEPALAWRTVELVDTSRASTEIIDGDGNVAFEGSDNRSIPTVILYPGTDGGGPDAPVADTPARPLVLYLKGFGGLNGPTDPLLVKLAEAGYIVAAPNIREVSEPFNHFPGYVEQPGDAQFVIDALTDPDDGFADDLAPVIDPLRIGLTGHSIGAAAAFGLAYHDCCRDERVDAVVAFGANPDRRFAESDFVFVDTPLLLVYGSDDDIAPVDSGTAILDVAQPPSHLLTLPGADHFSPVYGAGDGGDGDRAAMTAATVGIAFLDLHVAGTTSQEEFADLTASLEPDMWNDATG